MNNITFTMIKPSAVKENNIGSILKIIEEAKFVVKGAKFLKMTNSEAAKFYEIHKDKGFYNDLCSIMSKGPVFVMVLEKENAVKDFRKLIGATNPKEAEDGTIRSIFGKSIDENAIHGSDSDTNAQIEANFFFSSREFVY